MNECGGGVWLSLEDWNRRDIEDALREQIAEMRATYEIAASLIIEDIKRARSYLEHQKQLAKERLASLHQLSEANQRQAEEVARLTKLALDTGICPTCGHWTEGGWADTPQVCTTDGCGRKGVVACWKCGTTAVLSSDGVCTTCSAQVA